MALQPIDADEAGDQIVKQKASREAVKLEFMLSQTQQRQLVGGLGIFFPFVLIASSKLLFGTELQISLSHYYHTGVRDIFVGILFLMGAFLIFYKGYNDVSFDEWLSTAAGVCAIGTALFPTFTSPKATRDELIIGYIHFGFALTFLVILGLFVLIYFRRSFGAVCQEKLRRNKIYTVCGWLIFASVACIIVILCLPTHTQVAINEYKPVLFLETIAIVSFGVAWLIKGEWLFTKYLGLLDP